MALDYYNPSASGGSSPQTPAYYDPRRFAQQTAQDANPFQDQPATTPSTAAATTPDTQTATNGGGATATPASAGPSPNHITIHIPTGSAQTGVNASGAGVQPPVQPLNPLTPTATPMVTPTGGVPAGIPYQPVTQPFALNRVQSAAAPTIPDTSPDPTVPPPDPTPTGRDPVPRVPVGDPGAPATPAPAPSNPSYPTPHDPSTGLPFPAQPGSGLPVKPDDWTTATAGLGVGSDTDHTAIHTLASRLTALGYQVQDGPMDAQGRMDSLVINGVLHRVFNSSGAWVDTIDINGSAWGASGGSTPGNATSFSSALTPQEEALLTQLLSTPTLSPAYTQRLQEAQKEQILAGGTALQHQADVSAASRGVSQGGAAAATQRRILTSTQNQALSSNRDIANASEVTNRQGFLDALAAALNFDNFRANDAYRYSALNSSAEQAFINSLLNGAK